MFQFRLSARVWASILFLLALAGPAAAQADQRIVAVVNDEIVSAYDFESRMRLVLFSTRLADTPTVRKRIRKQVLDALINEKLQLQEARRLKIRISDRDLARSVEMTERQNNIPKGGLIQLLKRSNVPEAALRAQNRANLAWFQVVDLRLRPRVVVGDEEIDEILQRIEARQGQTEYRLGEILLAVDAPGREGEVLKTARRIVEQTSKGARFSAIAKQFSQSPTAAVGGDLGWVHESDLEPELLRALTGKKPGQFLEPLRTLTGVRIIRLRDTRKIAQVRPAAVRLDLHQLLLPAGAAGSSEDLEASARQIRTTTVDCAGFDAQAKKVGSPLPPALGTMELETLSPMVRKAVGSLSAGQISAPLPTSAGLLLLMVCSREEVSPEIILPDRETIRERLHRQRLARLAQSYLRNLRLASVVDLRG